MLSIRSLTPQRAAVNVPATGFTLKYKELIPGGNRVFLYHILRELSNKNIMLPSYESFFKVLFTIQAGIIYRDFCITSHNVIARPGGPWRSLYLMRLPRATP